MTNISRDIFKAIHEGKWLQLEYRNKQAEITHYWFAIENIDIEKRMLVGSGLHLAKYTVQNDMRIYISEILSTQIVDGTYMPQNRKLLEDIKVNSEKYDFIFSKSRNLRVLNYLSDCNILEGLPALNTNFHLIEQFDDATACKNQPFPLSENQFSQIIDNFSKQTKRKTEKGQRDIQQLCLNLLSIHTQKGLYVLAYREMLLDVQNKTLRPSEDILFNKEFSYISETKEQSEKDSISNFIDADDLFLLSDFYANIEEIENIISSRIGKKQLIDDRPYFLCLYRRCNVDLEKEYEGILQMYKNANVTIPIQAFFGELKENSPNKYLTPITVLDKNINLDQLLSIHNAMNYPVSYIQGPPGTGKTNTIINTIITAFFNGKTVLFASYNNHPIDTVFEKLSSLKYYRNDRNKTIEIIPFPVLRLGNNDKVKESLKYIRALYDKTKNITIYPETLMRNRDEKIDEITQLVELLKRHREAVDLRERKETLESLLDNSSDMEFKLVLESNQLSQIKKRLDAIGKISDEDAIKLLDFDSEKEFRKYLFYTSADYIQNLALPEYKDLLEIVFMEDEEKQVIAFNRYISNTENLKLLQNIFPIICTTCISAHKLGGAEPIFDMTIIDEASQCNTAVSLVPIIRGNALMLVGDPQQLNPVITLDVNINENLKENYTVSDDYDYISNSIYKSFLANDAVSEEILLHNHYRCTKEIINFNNKKYYNNQLNIMCESVISEPLVYYNVKDDCVNIKNTSQEEANRIVDYIKENPTKNIGIITPFKNQQELIEFSLKEAGLDLKKYSVGTVHKFQGDEKDSILFSLALTDKTHPKTYDWVRNNRELINVATSRAKNKLVILSDDGVISKLHEVTKDENGDDLYELCEYVKSNGTYKISQRDNVSRALGTKPYKTETEQEFLTTLNHALSNIVIDNKKYIVRTEVQISHLFKNNISLSDFFYRGSFDFVVYKIGYRGKEEAVLAIELNGREHYEDEKVKKRDEEKKRICKEQGFDLIYVENSYARRYNYIKDILSSYFGTKKT